MLTLKGRTLLLAALVSIACLGAVRADFYEGFTTWPNSNWRDVPTWHTVTIIRRSDKVVLILDGVMQGEYTSNVATTALPIAIDCTRLLAAPLVGVR